jgi:hypothetical protein
LIISTKAGCALKQTNVCSSSNFGAGLPIEDAE